MKKFYISAVSILLASVLFAGCNLFFGANIKEDLEDGNGIKLVLVDPSEKLLPSSTVSSKTVRPDIVWGNYNYTFEIWAGYVDESSKGTYVPGFNDGTGNPGKVPFKTIEDKQYPMTPANYKFVLTGYSTTSNKAVIRGQAIADLSNGAKTVEFKMYPVTGLKGSAEVTIKIPKDGTVAVVKAGWSTDPVAKDSTLEAAGKLSTLAITSGTTENSAKLTLTDLDSAVEQYAIFYLYDANGGLIATRAESLYIVGERKSVENNLEITEDDYHSYQVTVNLKKDGETWSNSNKTFKLVDKNDSSIEYGLTQNALNQNVFNGNASEGVYYIYDGTENTGVEFDTTEGSFDLNYYTVNLAACKGTKIVVVSGGVLFETNKALAVKGQSFVYKVQIDPGYEKNTGFAINVNGTKKSETVDVNLEDSISAETTIEVVNVKAIEYTISYDISGGGTWQAGYPAAAAKTYTVETSVELPTLEHLRMDGRILDGWKLSTDVSANPKVFAKTPSDITGNIIVVPVWKESVQIDTVNKKIYACGISLICQWKDAAKSETNLYVDWNRNGVKDSDDEQVVAADGTKNFTGYEFYAYNKDGSLPASDFYFTMKGGNISSFTGLGANSVCETHVNLSGNSIIGDGATKGVDLTSITNEWVTVIGQMEGNYSITVFCQYVYNRNDPRRIIAYIGDRSWADFSHFKCIYNKDNSVSKISYLDITEGSETKTIVYLVDPDPIAFSPDSDVIWKEENPDTNFTFGDKTEITAACSVFSVSVTNGSFKVTQTKMKDADGKTIETIDLGQIDDVNYDQDGLITTHNYKYIHMMSKENQISPDAATRYLKSIEFIKDDPNVDINIKINLETVSYEEVIKPMGEKFSYYDGSFYLGVDKGASITWYNAYNEARATKFNGLNGYLINITSEVENGYIYKQMGLGQCWTGGARYEPGDGYLQKFDQLSVGTRNVSALYNEEENSGYTASTPSAISNISKFYWVSGPEAGTWYTNGKWPDKKVSGTTTTISVSGVSSDDKLSGSKPFDSYANTDIYILDSSNRIIGEGKSGSSSSKSGWFGSTTYYLDVSGIEIYGTPAYVAQKQGAKVTTIEPSGYGYGEYSYPEHNGFTSWDDKEPNDSAKGSSEQCMHFLKSGKWNDYAFNNGDVKGYIVEFTPYDTSYGLQVSSDQSITKTASY